MAPEGAVGRRNGIVLIQVFILGVLRDPASNLVIG